MDHKAWLWRKKSSEKTIFAANKVDNRLRRTELEVVETPVDNGVVGAERSAKALNEKLASVLLDCPVEEDLAAKPDEETIADVLFSQENAINEKTAILENKLDEEEKKVREYEKANKMLEEKHAEAIKRLATLRAENAEMAKALLVKERLIEDSNARKSRAEAESGALMARLDSTEKENAFLRYEFGVVERELRIRTEEMEYYRRSADTLQKRQSESAERIAKLEQECQRPRVAPAARKRLNGPPSPAEERRRKPNPSRDVVVARDAVAKDLNFMSERLRAVEEENEALKRVLSRLPKPGVDRRYKPCVSSDFDTGSDDAVSSSGSWANNNNALPNNRRASDISLMDDFVEMERLAIVSAEKPSGFGQRQDRVNGKPFDWLQVVLSAMLEQKHISKRSLAELIEDIKIALGFINSPATTAKRLAPKEADPPLPISGYLTWNSTEGSQIPNSPSEEKRRSSLSESAGKIIKLIRDVNPGTTETSADYFIRVFQWRNSELNSVLQRFVRTCDDLASESCDLERFSEEVGSALDWILNNYVAPKEAADARDKIKRHFGWNDTAGRTALEEENGRLRDELKSVVSEKAEVESRLNSAVERSERLQAELDVVREKKGTIEDQIENEKLISDDLDTQLSVAKAKLSEVFQRVSCLEVELEDKRNCCEELEATCLELQLQLESDVAKETPDHKTGQEEKKSQSGWEITAASVKLAECQETIVNLGKQLKALATPKEAAILDSVFYDTCPGPVATAPIKDKNLNNKRSSLRDRMLAEDGPKTVTPQSDGTDSSDVVVAAGYAPAVEACRSLRCKPGSNAGVALAIVQSKKKGGGFDLLRKLLLKRRRSNGQKSRYSAKV